MLGLDVSMAAFTSRFDLPYEREQDVMRLDPDAPDFPARLEQSGWRADGRRGRSTTTAG